MPGASRVAGRLRRLADRIDEVVAGQLWIQICGHSPDDSSYVAKKILGRVAKESMAELGVGELAKRRDPMWSATVVVDAFEESQGEELSGEETDDAATAKEEINDLLQRAIDSGKLSAADRDLLLDLAHAAASTRAPGRRGRGGLMTPSVTQMVEESHAMSSRSVRRHASSAIKALQEEAEFGRLAM